MSAPPVGVMYANVGALASPEGARALALACAELGVESVWTVEHVVVTPAMRQARRYPPDRRTPDVLADQQPVPDPLLWLTWFAAHSSDVRLGTAALVLPLRDAAVTAKEVATLDMLSGGRVELGIGVGWAEDEFRATGHQFAGRGRLVETQLDTLRELWGERPHPQAGGWVRPAPVQRPVPLHICGSSPVAARRAARLGAGFLPARLADAARLVPYYREQAARYGGDPARLPVTLGASTRAEHRELLRALAPTRVLVPPPAGPAEKVRDQLAALLSRYAW
ncbi:TIGR03619 family F420-dependent LLM class oxidoreductase [Asanoa iriomotensis]|uniref:LLM class F420-dependent oxidoreductase n=1 Tax=Asanoa iriomotensis TaxID=234613 RepID=A0ABQ4C3Y7_9ACTN|nr:TIGR03619 family F420-dependent LLM class oxidoreductase [Asanoa iriomotensis]GIF57482.1 LLM class F420-dependent oxidoreductase [Asanoa iriomotensis]